VLKTQEHLGGRGGKNDSSSRNSLRKSAAAFGNMLLQQGRRSSSKLNESTSLDDLENDLALSPTQQHNHRPLTKLQYLQYHAEASSPTPKSKRATLKSKSNQIVPLDDENDTKDRAALESFFQATHTSDADWTSSDVLVGNGRSNWLDRVKGIERWQGITVNKDVGSVDKGRVIKFQLPRNNIKGN
jgi:hypothetical protein